MGVGQAVWRRDRDREWGQAVRGGSRHRNPVRGDGPAGLGMKRGHILDML